MKQLIRRLELKLGASVRKVEQLTPSLRSKWRPLWSETSGAQATLDSVANKKHISLLNVGLRSSRNRRWMRYVHDFARLGELGSAIAKHRNRFAVPDCLLHEFGRAVGRPRL